MDINLKGEKRDQHLITLFAVTFRLQKYRYRQKKSERERNTGDVIKTDGDDDDNDNRKIEY